VLFLNAEVSSSCNSSHALACLLTGSHTHCLEHHGTCTGTEYTEVEIASDEACEGRVGMAWYGINKITLMMVGVRIGMSGSPGDFWHFSSPIPLLTPVDLNGRAGTYVPSQQS